VPSAIVALLVLAPRAATAAISAGPARDVPWMQHVDYFPEVTAAVLADGSFALASTEVLQITPQVYTVRLQAQFFRPNGGAQTQPLVLIRSPGAVSYAGVGSLGSRYFLVWQDDRRAHVVFYSEEGTRLGEPFSWPYSDIADFAGYYRFGDAPRWRFLPITYRLAGYDADNNPLYRTFLRVAGPDGQLLGPPVALAPEDDLAYLDDAAINGSGRFVVVSTRCSGADATLPCPRGLQIFDGAFRPHTPFLSADVAQDEEPGGVRNGAFRTAIGPQGQVLLTWFTDQQAAVPRFVARLYDENGSPASDVLPVVEPPVPQLSPIPRVKALDDGTFVLSWRSYSPVDNTWTLVVDRFDPRTRSFEAPVTLAVGHIRGALLELNGAGKGVVVWQTEELDDAGRLLSVDGHLRVIRVK
jgi:hypothetical protein